MPCGATQDGRVMVERSDRMWSTGEGNGRPFQCSCLENPMNSMKRPCLSLELFTRIAIPQSGLLSQASSLRLPCGHSGWVLTLSNAALSFQSLPRLLVANASVWAAAPLGSCCQAHNLWVLIIYLSSWSCCPLRFQGSPQTRQRECFLVFGNFSVFSLF